MLRKMWKVLTILALALLLGAGQAEAAKRLQFGTWKQGSSWYVYGATIANLVNNAKVGVQIDPLAKGGGHANPINVGTGKFDLGLTFAAATSWAYQGKVAYKKPFKNLRVLVAGFDEFFLGIVTMNPKVNSISDLKANKIPVNYVTVPRGGLGQWCTKALLEAHGMTYEDIKGWGGTVMHTGFKVIISRLKDGQADMFSHTVNAGHPSLTQIAIQKKGKIRFLGIEEKYRDKLEAVGLAKATLPANTFPGQTKALGTMGLTTGLLTNTSISNDAAYKIVKVISEKVDDFRAGHKALRKFKPEKTAWNISKVSAPLHPGAARYYKERGWIK